MDLGLLQEEVAAIIGVSTDSVTYWENGRAVPQIQHMPKIIEFLGYNPIPINENTLGGRVKKYRLKHGLSHEEFGRILGVHGSTVGSWEKEEFIPSKASLNTLKNLLRK